MILTGLIPTGLIPTGIRRFSVLAGLLCAAGPALAQVTVDLHALDALPGAKPPAKATAPRRTPPRPSPRPSASAKPDQANPQQPAATPAPEPSNNATQAAPAPPPATLPAAPPPSIALAPVPPPPVAQAAPPPPPPISDTATGSATAAGAGLRVTFGAEETDLSPTSAAAIQDLVHSAPQGDSTTFNVVAYAAGTPEDPSTARRLSLSRALAVRSALIADGVGSARIYVRALGAVSGDGPADRVDLSLLGGNTPASAPVGKQEQAPVGAPGPAPSDAAPSGTPPSGTPPSGTQSRQQ